MKPFKLLRKNKRTQVMDVGPVFYHPLTFEPVRGITYSDEDGNPKYCIIDTGHPLWDDVTVLNQNNTNP
jgi:hypothetical protein